jgi:hypothetical protein
MIGHKLLDQVRKDLADVVQVCEGELKQTNHLRTLMSSLTKGSSLLPFSLQRILIHHRNYPCSLEEVQSAKGDVCV